MANDGLVRMQKQRDQWRGYAEGKYPRPNDYLDGNKVDRGPSIEDRISEARQTGRREGLEGFAQRAEGFTSPWYSPEEIAAIVRIYAEDMRRRELIDSPKAEVEEPPKMLYVAFDCLGNPYAVSTRPEHIACDPARIKPYVPVEAEGEEPDGK